MPSMYESARTLFIPANTGRKKRLCERTLALTPVNAAWTYMNSMWAETGKGPTMDKRE